MEIRPFDDQYTNGLVQLWNEVLPDSQPHNDPLRSIRRKQDFDNNNLLLVAVDGDQVIGAVIGGYDGHRGWIYSLAVEPTHRRQGIATALLQSIETRLHDLGCPKVNLQVRDTNHTVIEFYKKLGYATEPRISMGKLL